MPCSRIHEAFWCPANCRIIRYTKKTFWYPTGWVCVSTRLHTLSQRLLNILSRTLSNILSKRLFEILCTEKMFWCIYMYTENYMYIQKIADASCVLQGMEAVLAARQLWIGLTRWHDVNWIIRHIWLVVSYSYVKWLVHTWHDSLVCDMTHWCDWAIKVCEQPKARTFVYMYTFVYVYM